MAQFHRVYNNAVHRYVNFCCYYCQGRGPNTSPYPRIYVEESNVTHIPTAQQKGSNENLINEYNN